MKVKKTMHWEETLVEAHQRKINFYKELYCADTYKSSADKVVKKTLNKKSFWTIIKNFIKKICKIKICH